MEVLKKMVNNATKKLTALDDCEELGEAGDSSFNTKI